MTATISTTSAFQTTRSLFALGLLAALAAGGCAADTGVSDEDAEAVDVGGSEQALNNGSGGTRLGYNCTNGTCTCDKSIENDCENMSSECTDASIDALIACINGWLTTGCTCPQIRAVKGGGSVRGTVTGGVLTTGTLTTGTSTTSTTTKGVTAGSGKVLATF